MNYLGSKKIETDRLILRSTEESDLKVLWQILCIPDVNKYYLTCKLNSNWEDEKKWQYKKLSHSNDNNVFQWSIILKDTNECIGQISVQENGPDKSIRDIGWFIEPRYQRRGYAYETASAILKYMFEEVQINAIETSAAVCNPASWRLMAKLGFKKREGKTIINHYTFGGDIESYLFGITKEEYQEKSVMIINIMNNKEYLKQYIKLCSLEWGTKKNNEEMEKYIQKKLDSIKNRDKVISVLGLIENNKLLGFISLFKYDGDERKDLSPWYATMYIKEKYRGFGYSKLLNLELLKEAKYLGFDKVYLKSNLQNYYEKFGAKYIETLNSGEKLYYIMII